MNLFLLAGAATGLLLALSGLLRSDDAGPPLPREAVARVGDTLVLRADYERALAALAADRRQPLGPADRRFVLERLVDEALLVERGLELDLGARDPRIRADLVQAVVGLVTAQGEEAAGAPDEAALRAFYERESPWFRRPGRLRVEALLFRERPGESADQSQARADEARGRWQGGEPWHLLSGLADPPVVPVESGWTTLARLADRLGATPARSLGELAPGQVSQPVRGADGLWVLRVVEREPGRLLAFEEVRDQVEREWLRRAGEEALVRFLEERRSLATVTLAQGLP
jgi:hypothetical protein